MHFLLDLLAGRKKTTPLVDKFLKGYFDCLLELCYLDSDASTDLMKVGTLLEPFQSLFRPKMIVKVILYRFKRWFEKTFYTRNDLKQTISDTKRFGKDAPIYR